MAHPVRYIHVAPECQLPEVAAQAPFRAVVIAEEECSHAWQAEVCGWLVKTGCLYMMAWGKNCTSWDDSVDIANLERFGFEDIPDDQFIMTTWHQDEPLEEVFWFSKNNSHHPTQTLTSDLLLHIAVQPRELELLRSYAEA